MRTKLTYWLDLDGRYLGYLNEFPDHWTQGEFLEDLKVPFRDLAKLFAVETPGIRREIELDLE